MHIRISICLVATLVAGAAAQAAATPLAETSFTPSGQLTLTESNQFANVKQGTFLFTAGSVSAKTIIGTVGAGAKIVGLNSNGTAVCTAQDKVGNTLTTASCTNNSAVRFLLRVD